jgi:hypothetical protein
MQNCFQIYISVWDWSLVEVMVKIKVVVLIWGYVFELVEIGAVS